MSEIINSSDFFAAMSPEVRSQLEEKLREMAWSFACATAVGYTREGERVIHWPMTRELERSIREATLEVFVIRRKLPTP